VERQETHHLNIEYPLLSSSHPNEPRTYFARSSIYADQCHVPKLTPPLFYDVVGGMLSTSMLSEVDFKCLNNNIIHKWNQNNVKLLKQESVVTPWG
jgi:hypothetical protein